MAEKFFLRAGSIYKATNKRLQNDIEITGADIVEVANRIQMIDTGGSPYTSYVAIITQTGTNAPAAEVLLNTLGGEVVWTRDSPGRYIATLEGAFILGRTICPPFDNAGYVYMPISGDTLFEYGYQISEDPTLAPNAVAMNVAKASDFSPVDFGVIFENIPRKILVEIRVYAA